jgi:hypothetical protein
MALATLWVVFTPTQPAPQPTPVDYQTLLHLQAAHVILRAQSEEPVSVELRVPMVLVTTPLTEERSKEAIDLRVPEALLEHLYGAGRPAGLQKSLSYRIGLFSGEISVAPH